MSKYTFNKEMAISTYCAPQVPITFDGEDYPDRVTEEQYRKLKDCGLNLAMGQSEVMNTPTEKFVFRALEICEKLGIKYLVKDNICREYCGLGGKYKDCRKMTEEEKQELDDRFYKSLLRYKDYPAFEGIIMVDEPGSDMFPSIARAKKVFDKVCPDKIFFVNLFPYYISEKQYQFGWEKGVDGDIDIEYKPFVKPNIERYMHHLKLFLDTVDTEIVCFDAYPFVAMKGFEQAVHYVHFELTQYVAQVCRERKKKFWFCLQTGGKWYNDVRITTFGEAQLNVNIPLAYGASGFVMYTGCFPNDCLENKKEHSGILGRYGERTEQYPVFDYAFMQIRAVEKYLSDAELKATVFSGSKYFGLLKNADKIAEYENAEGGGRSVYDGRIPEYGDISVKEYKELKGVFSTTQVMVSCFELNGKSEFMVVNTSPYAATDFTLKFDNEYEMEYIKGTYVDNVKSDVLTVDILPAGEFVFIRILK